MRENPDYQLTDEAAAKQLIRSHPWATMFSTTADGPVASHYPFLLEADAEGISVVSHVGRPDERLHALATGPLLVVFYGPSGYISPSWYGISPAVPTWNFATVHLTGVPEILSDDENLAVLERLVDHFEGPLPEPFRMRRDELNVAYAERIVHGTVGFRLRADSWHGKDKMSQDKPAEVVDRVITELEGAGPYANPELARRMRATHGRERGGS
jgi:transcriptional regulator